MSARAEFEKLTAVLRVHERYGSGYRELVTQVWEWLAPLVTRQLAVVERVEIEVDGYRISAIQALLGRPDSFARKRVSLHRDPQDPNIVYLTHGPGRVRFEFSEDRRAWFLRRHLLDESLFYELLAEFVSTGAPPAPKD